MHFRQKSGYYKIANASAGLYIFGYPGIYPLERMYLEQGKTYQFMLLAEMPKYDFSFTYAGTEPAVQE